MSANKVFKYGELEAPFDLSDYVFAEKWENALDAVQAARVDAQKQLKNSDKIKGMVMAVADMYDEVFGVGAANKALGKTTSLDDAIAAFNALVVFSREQNTDMAKKWQQYAPNREQRRAKK